MDHNNDSLSEHRTEEKWSDDNTQFFKNIMADCNERSVQHGRAGRKFKKINNGLTIPTMLLPIVLSTLSNELAEQHLLNDCLLIGLACLNGVNAFFDFSKKSSNHLEFESRYEELNHEIESELVKAKNFRTQFDVYLTEISMKYSMLNKSAPML